MIFFLIDLLDWSSSLVRLGHLEEFVLDIARVVLNVLLFNMFAFFALTLHRRTQSRSVPPRGPRSASMLNEPSATSRTTFTLTAKDSFLLALMGTLMNWLDRDDDMDRDLESGAGTDMDCGVDFGGTGIAFFVCIVALTTTVALCSYFLLDFCRDLIFCGHRYFFPTIDDFVTAVNSHVVLVGVDGGCVIYDIASMVDNDDDCNDPTMKDLMAWVDTFYDDHIDIDIDIDIDIPPMDSEATCVIPTTISKKRVTFSEQLVSSTFIVQRRLSDKIARGLKVALFPCKKIFPSRSFVATGRVLPTISEDCVTVSAQVVSSTRIVQRDLSDKIARGLEIASRECEKDEDDAYDTYDDDHDDDNDNDDDNDGGGGGGGKKGNDDSVKDLEPEPVPDVNVFCHSFPETLLDCGKRACDDEDDKDDDDHIHDDKDEHKDDTDDTIYEVVKKQSRSRTKYGVVLPVRRSARLAERRLRLGLQQILHDQENKLQDQECNDTTSTNASTNTSTNTNTVLQTDVLGSTFVNGRRRSARHLTSTNMASSGL